jgi:hypothetical protein
VAALAVVWINLDDQGRHGRPAQRLWQRVWHRANHEIRLELSAALLRITLQGNRLLGRKKDEDER